MTTAREYEFKADYGVAADYVEPRGAGWVTFAAVMLGLVGTWNVIDGMLAIFSSRVYTDNAVYVFSDLNTWGWIVMILGILQVLAALAVVGGSELARWFGIAVASVNAIGQLAFVPIYPLWGISMFAVDVLIIYALAVYGGKRQKQAI